MKIKFFKGAALGLAVACVVGLSGCNSEEESASTNTTGTTTSEATDGLSMSNGTFVPTPTNATTVAVPNVVGMGPVEATSTVKAAGLKYNSGGLGYDVSSQPLMKNFEQSPVAGTQVARESEVKTKVSFGPTLPTNWTLETISPAAPNNVNITRTGVSGATRST